MSHKHIHMDNELRFPAPDTTNPMMMSNVINGYELRDLTDEANFDQFIDLIRGEAEVGVGRFIAAPDYDFGVLGGGLFDDHFAGAPGMFGDVAMGADHDCVVNSLPSIGLDMMVMGGGGGEFDYNDDEDSSGTTNTTADTNPAGGGNDNNNNKKNKVDRSRTLVSERRRRGRMKEKLYALRSLVPNITKMDKASIVGDAALYVQQLQMQANKLKSEIAGLEASLSTSEKYQTSFGEPNKILISKPNLPPISPKMITQMDVFQVEERGFYVRLVCNKGEGIAASLYKALETLTGFIVQSSNLATVSETFVLTFTLNVRESEQKKNLPNLKLWVTGALMNQGFEFKISASG